MRCLHVGIGNIGENSGTQPRGIGGGLFRDSLFEDTTPEGNHLPSSANYPFGKPSPNLRARNLFEKACETENY